jgi:hypothetical protein
VARLIAFTASPNNITGAEYLIDGGIAKKPSDPLEPSQEVAFQEDKEEM